MKRLIITILISILICSNMFAQLKLDKKLAAKRLKVDNKTDSTVITIKGTEKDTSKVFDLAYLTNLHHWFADTSGSDSVNVKTFLDILGSKGWTTIDSISVTADSVSERWFISTHDSLSFGIGRFRWEGQTGNKQKGYVLSENVLERKY